MTFQELERDTLSLRAWALRTVLPTAIALTVALGVLAATTGAGEALDHKAVIVGFLALYFVLVRGGHLIMIRSLHLDLKKHYEEPYEKRLAQLPSVRGRNAGFALARIKRDLIDAGVIPNANPPS